MRYLLQLDLEATPELCRAGLAWVEGEFARAYRPTPDNPLPYSDLVERLGCATGHIGFLMKRFGFLPVGAILAVVGVLMVGAGLKWRRKRRSASMNLITEITEADFLSSHPELHHYVDFGGLEGIFKNQTLWATNYRQLNDTKETAILKQPLVQALTSRFRSLVEYRQRTEPAGSEGH